MSPLIQGASVLTFRLNYDKLIREGYPKNQAFAISVGITKKNYHKVSKSRQQEIDRGKFFGTKSPGDFYRKTYNRGERY